METTAKTDGRREVGERTRQRLLEATRALLAERGEDAVTLRDITDAAGANVAAVSYHFGSVGALRRAAIEEAIQTLVEASIERVRALDDGATVDQIAAAWAQPVIEAVSDTRCTERAFLRIMARVVANPPCELQDWLASTIWRADAELVTRLRRALPDVPEDELRFRAECVGGIMNFLVTGRTHVELAGKTTAELERLLVPVITGALAAGGPLRR
jgi:AcrR family transcriptional regulator